MVDDASAFELARSHLPPLVRWAQLPAIVLTAGGTGWLIATLGARAGGRVQPNGLQGPWPERARLTFPSRVGASAGVGIAALVGLLLAASFGGPWGAASGWPASALGCAAAVAGATVGSERLERRLGLGVGVAARLRDLVSWGLAFHGKLVVAVTFAGLANVVTTWGAWPWLLAGAIMLAALTRDPLVLVRATGLLRPAPEPLRIAVERLAARTGTDLRGGVHVLRWSRPNALAYPVSSAVVLTQGALTTFSEDELLAICAHELAHLREPRRVVVLRVITSIAGALPFLTAPVAPAWLTAALLFAWLFGSRRVQARLRRFELIADAAARVDEPNPGVYGRALERLHEATLTPVVLAGEQSHPHLVDRLEALGRRPPYASLQPPPRKRIGRALLVAAGAAVASLLGVSLTLAILTHARPALAVVVTAGETRPLMAYATEHAVDHPELAAALVRACTAHEARQDRCVLGSTRLAADQRSLRSVNPPGAR